MIVLARNWWALVLRGLLGVLFGLAAFVWPGISLAALVLLFGAYALLDGIVAVIGAVRAAERHGRWLPLLLEGIVGVVVGVLTFIWPAITALALLYLIAAWALLTGIFELAAAVRLRREVDNEWLLGLAGVASIGFGLILAAFPGAGALAAVWIIGAYALMFGMDRVGGWTDAGPGEVAARRNRRKPCPPTESISIARSPIERPRT
jgi:uncharacterized membrane protein HdeD (DUF308 family)